MKDKKIYARILILLIFAVTFCTMFVITKVGYCYSDVLWIQCFYYICFYFFMITLTASIIVAFMLVYKEVYNLIWLIELFSLIGFFALLFNLCTLACVESFIFNWEYTMIVYLMFFVNTFNGICRLGRKSKNFKEEFVGLLKEPVKNHDEERWSESPKQTNLNEEKKAKNVHIKKSRIFTVVRGEKSINLLNDNNESKKSK